MASLESWQLDKGLHLYLFSTSCLFRLCCCMITLLRWCKTLQINNTMFYFRFFITSSLRASAKLPTLDISLAYSAARCMLFILLRFIIKTQINKSLVFFHCPLNREITITVFIIHNACFACFFFSRSFVCAAKVSFRCSFFIVFHCDSLGLLIQMLTTMSINMFIYRVSQKTGLLWELISLRQLMKERHVICEKFLNFV